MFLKKAESCSLDLFSNNRRKQLSAFFDAFIFLYMLNKGYL